VRVVWIPGGVVGRAGGEVLLSYMGYIGMCGPKGYGFLAILVTNKVSILAILFSNRVWFFRLKLD